MKEYVALGLHAYSTSNFFQVFVVVFFLPQKSKRLLFNSIVGGEICKEIRNCVRGGVKGCLADFSVKG